jgi:hypothetical protein
MNSIVERMLWAGLLVVSVILWLLTIYLMLEE